MSEKVQLKGCISELNFGYNAKTVVYTNSSSDITKLGEIAGQKPQPAMGSVALLFKQAGRQRGGRYESFDG